MTENTKPLIGGYNTNGGTRAAPPAAARFNGGAQHRAEIEHAAEARREQSHDCSGMSSGPSNQKTTYYQ
jgi:hypothetical protein